MTEQKKITITFDKGSAKFVYDLLLPSIKDKTCPACYREVTSQELGGVFHFKGEPRMCHSNLTCILTLEKDLVS